mgnify:CR=1 FL=1
MKKSHDITAVIPAAGLGTRLLPATKAISKELLPIIDTPAIQLIVEEIVGSGIDHVVFVTARGKSSIIDYFDSAPQLERTLAARGEDDFLEKITRPVMMANYASVRQGRPLGLGHAILMAREIVGENDLAVLLPDDLIDSDVPCLKQMISAREETGADLVMALMEVPAEEVDKYGVVAGNLISDRHFEITSMVEKPSVDQAPSHYAIIGRYLFSSELFTFLRDTQKGKGGEIQLTDAMAAMLRSGKRAVGYLFDGKRFDTGNVLGYVEANLHYGLKRPELKEPLKQLLKELLDR